MGKEKVGQKGRKWIFTSQQGKAVDFSKEQLDALASLLEKTATDVERLDYIKYVKLAIEEGETGNIHIQGYVETKNSTTFGGVVKMFREWDKLEGGITWNNPHIEFAWNPKAAIAYIGDKEYVHRGTGEKKGGHVFSIVEKGTPYNDSGEAKRKGSAWNEQLQEIKEKIDKGYSLSELWREHFVCMVYTHRAIEAYWGIVASERGYNYKTGEEGSAKKSDGVPLIQEDFLFES